MKYNEYYNQPCVWGNNLTDGEKNRISATISILPKDVLKLLDVGCGDGCITALLRNYCDVVAMDISYVALCNIQSSKRVVGNIAEMPFQNKTFDLVLATEVLEHLPNNIFRKTIHRMIDVSKKYILVSVPYKENLYPNFTKCQKCGEIYHLWNHVRTFNKTQLVRLFPGFHTKEIQFVGPKVGGHNNLLLFIKYYFGNGWNYSKTATCPKCNFKNDQPFLSTHSFVSGIIAALAWRFNKNVAHFFKNFSWIIILFERNA